MEAWQGSDSAFEHEGCHAHHFAVLDALVAGKGGAAAQQQQQQQQADAAAAAAAEEGHAGSSSCDSCCSDAEDADSVHDVQAALRRPLLTPVHKPPLQQQGQQEGVSQWREEQQEQHQREISQLVGVLLTEAGIIFHSGGGALAGREGEGGERGGRQAGMRAGSWCWLVRWGDLHQQGRVNR